MDLHQFIPRNNYTDALKVLGPIIGRGIKRGYKASQSYSRKKKRKQAVKPGMRLRNADSITTTMQKKKKKRKAKKKVSLKSRVSKLEKEQAKDSIFHYMNTDYIYMNSQINEKRWYDIPSFSHKHIEDTLTTLRVAGSDFDLLAEASNNDVNIACRNIYSKLLLKNNYTTNCILKVYWVQAKTDCDQELNTIIQEGFVDSGIPDSVTGASVSPSTGVTSGRPAFTRIGLNIGVTGPTNVHLSDAKQFMRSFKIIKSDLVQMGPGDSATSSYSRKIYNYKPRTDDNDPAVFQKGDVHCVVQLIGGLGHGSIEPDLVGWMASRIDAAMDIKYDVVYQGIGELRKKIHTDSYDPTVSLVYVEASPSVPDIVPPEDV